MMLLAITVFCTGCNSLLNGLLTSNAATFGLGYLLGSGGGTVTTECFLNGESIDCADMP